MNKLLYVLMTVLLTFVTNNITVGAEENLIAQEMFKDYSSTRSGSLYIGEALCKDSNIMITDDKILWFPIRGLLEGIGADINWYEESKEFSINYQNKMYIGYFAKSTEVIPRYLYVRERDSGNDLYLTPMSFGALYTIFDDNIYLTAQCATYLLKEFGYNVETDIINGTAKVSRA